MVNFIVKKLLLPLLIAGVLTGCNSNSNSPSTSIPQPQLKVGILPDTQADGVLVAEHAMRAVLDKHLENNVDVVIAVGDLVDKGTKTEFESWTTIAREYQAKGIEFLPLMGNHEESFSFTIDWIDYMSEFIPEDAVHQPKKEWVNYYVKRDNALLIQISYWELAFAFEWIKQVVNEHRDDVEHVFISSHDGLVGAKYGQTRELIVGGNKSDVRGQMLEESWDEIREFFFQNDVIWNQGHEHLYQRSTINAPEYLIPQGSTPTGGNYRLPIYTQVIAGNASYKGYDFRYGERDFVQNIIQMKMGTLDNDTSYHLDVNAAQYSIDGNRIRYESFAAPHTVETNEQGPQELQNPDWVMIDMFDRTTNRCEKIVDATTIAAKIETGDARPDGHDYSFRTAPCVDSNQLYARILGGENQLYNRIQNVERTMGWNKDKRAEDPSAFWARAQNYLYQGHAAWSPNFNAKERVLQDESDENNFIIPATSMDMKKHVTLSWDHQTSSDTLSDILVISGMTTHTGTYQNAKGGELDIEVDDGIKTTEDDWEKPVELNLPSHATKEWDITKQAAVSYAIEFDLPELENLDSVALHIKLADQWQAMSSAECIINEAYDERFLEALPMPDTGCNSDDYIVGYDEDKHAFWAVLHDDAELVLMKQ
ncbi:hypothetical protein A146_19030 [Vibrio splendidus FF-500]|nr:hypothetical protein A146_19030 [Vibrio splendidus FF-500]